MAANSRKGSRSWKLRDHIFNYEEGRGRRGKGNEEVCEEEKEQRVN